MDCSDLWVMSPPLLSSSSDEEFQSENLTLIPGLPDDLAALILSFLPFSHHNRLRSTCKLWKNFFSSKTLISIRRKHLHSSNLSHLLCFFSDDPTISSPYLFDPQNLAWCSLPPLPCNPHVYGLCNFTSVSHDSHLYVLGGSLFDTRSFPLDRPSPSSSAFRFDFTTQSWESISPMLSPRGSFACAAIPNSGQIIVAGGGSRHTMFGAAGSRMNSVEIYDIGKDEWVALDGLPRFRAGCVGFMVGNEVDDKEFWVMGGYGESRTVLGVFPVDEYYRDAVVMDLKNGGMGKWREVGDMWEEGERRRLGRIAVIEDINGGSPSVFMLDKSDIFRYDMASNRWKNETSIPKKLTDESSIGFIALDGELHIMGSINGGDSIDNNWKSRPQKRSASLFLQIYHPQKKKNPRVENEILKEIKHKPESLIYDEVKDMVYTHASLYETMRLYPPVAVDSKEAPDDDILPDGTVVKKGNPVTYHIYAMGRSEELWGSDWSEFRSERWLEKDVSGRWVFKSKDIYEYPVFQAGPRVCLGKEMAFLLMKRVVAGVLRRFRVVPAVDDGVDPVYVFYLTATMEGGFPVRIENRDEQ